MATKKHICGIYKGYKIIQEYEQIGNGIYGIFYPCVKKRNRWYKRKNFGSTKLESLKKCIDIWEKEKEQTTIK